MGGRGGGLTVASEWERRGVCRLIYQTEGLKKRRKDIVPLLFSYAGSRRCFFDLIACGEKGEEKAGLSLHLDDVRRRRT